MNGTLLSINISKQKGTMKYSVDEATLDMEGIVGDAHGGKWHRQISLLAREDISSFEKELGHPLAAGEFGENFTTEGIDLNKVGLLDRIIIGDAELEVTQIGKSCHGDGCTIYQKIGKCVMPKKGIFARVITPGKIKSMNKIELVKRPLTVQIITLSDRAFNGEYDDLSGPTVEKELNQFFENKAWQIEINKKIIQDEKMPLVDLLKEAIETRTDVVITTGGTGIGPRDITPDVVINFSDKLVPGIMEYIRIKYGEKNPNVLLSRSVVGIKDKTLIYTLPGSVKAVKEYMAEIVKTMEHAILMLHGLGH